MKAVLTDAAIKDLKEIARHIGKDDIFAARRFTAALRSRATAIGGNRDFTHWRTGWRRRACAVASTAAI